MGLEFDAAANDVVITAMPSPLVGPFTMACWVRPTALSNSLNYVLSVYSPDVAQWVGVYFTSSIWRAIVRNAGINHLNGPTATIGALYHIAVVQRNDSLAELWVDGALVASNTDDVSFTAGDEIRYVNRGAAGQDASAVLYEPAVWDYALSGRQIEALASGWSPMRIGGALPVSYRRLVSDLTTPGIGPAVSSSQHSGFVRHVPVAG